MILVLIIFTLIIYTSENQGGDVQMINLDLWHQIEQEVNLIFKFSLIYSSLIELDF